MQFSKYTGSGNDFILIDNRKLFFDKDNHALISKLCHRQYGIGADGVILLENSDAADFKMCIFNCDGFEAEMCGNGIRCLFLFIQECGDCRSSFVIETKSGAISLNQEGAHIKASMQNPLDIRWSIDLSIDSASLKLHHLNTGVPHTVIFSDSIRESDLKELAPKIRHHPAFLPKGTNVNFATIKNKSKISVRTYERGVEAETLACGTGATAAAIAAAYVHGICLPISVETKSGEELKINCTINETAITDVTMAGSALFVYKGDYNLRT